MEIILCFSRKLIKEGYNLQDFRRYVDRALNFAAYVLRLGIWVWPWHAALTASDWYGVKSRPVQAPFC